MKAPFFFFSKKKQKYQAEQAPLYSFDFGGKYIIIMTLCFFLAAAACALVLISQCGALTIDASRSIWIVAPGDQLGYGGNTPVQMAIGDVARDWYKTLGSPPQIIVSEQMGSAAIPNGFSGTAIFFGRAAAASAGGGNIEVEEHSISISKAGNATTMIFAAGRIGDARSQIYAAYEFAERVLHVEPLYFFTDVEPAYMGPKIEVDASSIAFKSGKPVYKFRGFFPNDEDLIGGFSADPLGQSVFSASMWNRICEALLRLKGNLMIPGTIAYPDESAYKVLARRAVMASQQHFTLLGTNTWRWPEGIPYSFDKNPEMQDHVWKACLAAYSGRETVWTIGYRGLNDYAFWRDEPKFNTTESRCKLISEAMAHQANIVRSTPGRENDFCATYLWSEMLDLYLSGKLVIPANTTKIFADKGGSGSFDPRIFDLVQENDGQYYHVQMESPKHMSQLTEMVPPSTFFDALRKFVAKKATSIFMLNLSDLKPALFSVDYIMRYLWNPSAYDALTPELAEEKVIASWCLRHYGKEYSADCAGIMIEYFQIPYIASLEKRYGDEHLSGMVRDLLDGSLSISDALDFVTASFPIVEALYSKTIALWNAMRSNSDARNVQLFESSTLLHISVHRFGLQAVYSTALGYLNEAVEAIEQIKASERRAEHKKWRSFYFSDDLVNYFNLQCLLRERASGPTTPSVCTIRDGQPYHTGTQKDSPWFLYMNTSINFPYLNKPPAEWSMELAVRIACASIGCIDTPVGGTFNATFAVVKMHFPFPSSRDELEIRYTVDGTEVHAKSPLYSAGGVRVNKTTEIAARVFRKTAPQSVNFQGTPLLVTRAVYTKVTAS